MRAKKIAHEQEGCERAGVTVIMIMTVHLLISLDLHIGPFPLFFYVNCGYFLGLPGFRLNSQGETLCAIIAV
ncbi:MAG: hypothetical protein JRE20_06380, partial [Deltaproteobacteria bacterium]|nr:hypothetical protein [Deltaproteobacteria bacterium]